MPLPIVFVSQDPVALDQAIETELANYDLNLSHPDVLVLSDKIGVEQIKKIAEHLLWKNTSHNPRAVVLHPINSLTTDAQNGLLKTLEEPAGNVVMMVGIDDQASLLPTVLSRCEIRYFGKPALSSDFSEVLELLALSVEDRLEKIEKNDDRQKLVETLASFYYSLLPKNPEYGGSLQLVLSGLSWIKQHVPAKAVSDFLMISLPKYAK